MTNVRTKKSNASSVQPRKPARTALRWFALALSEVEGRSAAFMCGAKNTTVRSAARYGALHLRAPVQHDIHLRRFRVRISLDHHKALPVRRDIEVRVLCRVERAVEQQFRLPRGE